MLDSLRDGRVDIGQLTWDMRLGGVECGAADRRLGFVLLACSVLCLQCCGRAKLNHLHSGARRKRVSFGSLGQELSVYTCMVCIRYSFQTQRPPEAVLVVVHQPWPEASCKP